MRRYEWGKAPRRFGKPTFAGQREAPSGLTSAREVQLTQEVMDEAKRERKMQQEALGLAGNIVLAIVLSVLLVVSVAMVAPEEFSRFSDSTWLWLAKQSESVDDATGVVP
eukprot:TRINITY_DN38547_c0_g1_i1.p1 TRINITY_DN38547_c0_g1~~TRINITY_DN38547_c0_g1_i1.p1  ORF type:complete len:110 (+),score=21.46 TRINITY_DN38547_c0_g1_i1:80-409(+)